MVCRVDGAHRLAGRVAAVLAEHRHEARFEVFPEPTVRCSLIVTLDAQPVHLSAALDVESESRRREERRVLPGGTDGRNVVLGITGRDAGGATGAAREVDGHRPAPRGHLARIVVAIEALLVASIGGRRRTELTLRIGGDGRAESWQERVTRVARNLL